jgi:hypothetical protein
MDWLESPELRRRCQAGLNKGEARHFLAHVIYVHRQGRITDRMVNCYSEEAEQTGAVPTRNKVMRPLLEWNLADLLRVAKAANWLPSGLTLGDDWDRRKAKVGDSDHLPSF